MSDEYDDANKDKYQQVLANLSQDLNISSDVDAGKRVETSSPNEEGSVSNYMEIK